MSGLVFNTWADDPFCSIFDSLLGIVIGYGLIRLADYFPSIFFAAISGLVVRILMIRMKILTFHNPIPFGPFLSLNACIFIVVTWLN